MENLPNCPQCNSALTYEDRDLFVCPECAHEWSMHSAAESQEVESDASGPVVKDAGGQFLKDGDTVSVVKDLKVKGAGSALKVGTKVRNIRLAEGDHNIDCRIEGFGEMKLKSQFVRKVAE